MIFADRTLARRVEAAETALALGCRAAGSAVLEVAGGCAIFAGVDSPLTQAVGLGLNGPVSLADLNRLESFFQTRGAPVRIDLCPLADPSFLDALVARRYRIAEFNNVLVRSLQSLELELAPHVRRALPDERDLWSHAVGYGFFEQPELSTPEMDIGRAVFDLPAVLCYLTAASGHTAGGGALAIQQEVAFLFSDSTIPVWRRLGLHRELIAARLNEAAARGCNLAAASTLPGSASQRNYERSGFQVAYTKITAVA